MITYVVCDLFQSPARVLVNTVNTVGVMGKGIAKDFKYIYPDMFKRYQRVCETGDLDIGNLWLYKTTNKWILNFPTKRHWRQPSHPEYIAKGLDKFVKMYHVHGITSISFPLLGCGNGELDWETQVRPIMEQYLRELPITVFIHLQNRQDMFTPEHRNIRAMREWLQGEPESLAFTEVWQDLYALLSVPSTFSRLDTGARFTVKVCRGPGLIDGLTVTHSEHDQFIPAKAFLRLWQQIRQSGFVSRTNLPYGLDTFSEYVIPIMSKLPYVQSVMMADRYSEVTQSALGLRLSARPRSTRLPLFASVGVVQPQ